MIGEHLDRERAALLALLAPNDAQLGDVAPHLESCQACMRLLAEARGVVRMLDGLPAPAAPTPAVLKRARAAVHAQWAHETEPQVSPAGRAFAAASIVLAVLSVVFALWAGVTGPLEIALGIKCLLIEMVFAALVCGVALGVRRRVPVLRSLHALTAIAAAGALAGQVWLHFECPAHGSAPHVLAFHTGGVVVALLLAEGLTRLWPPRAQVTG